jgi:hypothetical protein
MEASTGALFLIGGAILGLARYAGPRIAKRWKNDDDTKTGDRTSGPASTTTTPPRLRDRQR